MTDEVEFAAALARGLGPLYRVSVRDPQGEVTASFGQIDGNGRARAELALPNSSCSLLLEVDVDALEAADRVLHSIGASYLSQTRLPLISHLDTALDDLIAQGESYQGTKVGEMSRVQKQDLVRFLDERGAFALRKAVERVADILSVSRFTVYNYLDSARSS
jgi:HTH domain